MYVSITTTHIYILRLLYSIRGKIKTPRGNQNDKHRKGQGSYRNSVGEDYMMAVGSYDEETGEAWEAMTLAEAMKAMEEEEWEEYDCM
jgi:hypothetical protein